MFRESYVEVGVLERGPYLLLQVRTEQLIPRLQLLCGTTEGLRAVARHL